MSTRLELRVLVRRRLGDLAASYTFSDEQLNQWINDAIADYSLHFPWKKVESIDCSAGVHEYALPADFHGVLSVEYPAGDDPPTYLARLDYRDPQFGLGDGCYDLTTILIDPISGAAGPAIYLSADAETGETICVQYLGEHNYLDAENATTTIPDRHFELLVLFCRWAAYQELAMAEAANPDPTGLALGSLELNAGRAERQYRKEMAVYLQNDGESGQVVWKMDGWDKVY
jgi:hypothetical protein